MSVVNGSPDMVPVSLLGEALDEIYALRARLAYEARANESHLTLKTLPVSVRGRIERSVERMRACARGEWQTSHPEVHRPIDTWKQALKMAGARETLTRSSWEAEDPTRRRV